MFINLQSYIHFRAVGGADIHQSPFFMFAAATVYLAEKGAARLGRNGLFPFPVENLMYYLTSCKSGGYGIEKQTRRKPKRKLMGSRAYFYLHYSTNTSTVSPSAELTSTSLPMTPLSMRLNIFSKSKSSIYHTILERPARACLIRVSTGRLGSSLPTAIAASDCEYPSETSALTAS